MGRPFFVVQHVVLVQPVEGVSGMKARHQYLVDEELARVGAHSRVQGRFPTGTRIDGSGKDRVGFGLQRQASERTPFTACRFRWMYGSLPLVVFGGRIAAKMTRSCTTSLESTNAPGMAFAMSCLGKRRLRHTDTAASVRPPRGLRCCCS